uniref:VWA domain-containing protein n=1 Tax=uncultured Allobacillus sp. TaxID=1638025 RepID=UPI0025950178|nr:VWA domain-containing protein [uncultured Allobacillus sp.]
MRYIKGISIMTIVVLIFHIFGLNAGLLATSEQSTSNEVSVEYVTHTDEDIEWNLVVDVTSESEDGEVNVAIEFSSGLSHGSIDGTNSIDVEQTANGYLLKSSKSIQEEFKLTTVRTDDLVDSYQLKAVASFDGQQIEDFEEKSLPMPALTQLNETESNEQADESSSETMSDEENAEEQVESSEDDEAETEEDTGSSEEESLSEDGDEKSEEEANSEDESLEEGSADEEVQDESELEESEESSSEEEIEEDVEKQEELNEQPSETDQEEDALSAEGDESKQDEAEDELLKKKKNEKRGKNHPAFRSTSVPNALSGQSMGDEWPEPGSLKLLKEASDTGTYAEWEIDLSVEGKNLRNSSDIVIVFDRSGSMAGGRLAQAKVAAKEFVDELLIAGSTTRIALVEFSTQGTLSKDFTDYSGKQQLKNKINGISAGGGTNIQAGLHQAKLLLQASSADKKTVVLLSDGEPTYSFKANSASSYSWPGQKYNFILSNFDYTSQLGSGSSYDLESCWFFGCYPTDYSVDGYTVSTNGVPTISEAAHLMNSGIDMYSIGLSVGNNNDANYVLQNSQNKGYFSGGTDDLSPIFSEIAAQLAFAATNAVVTDPLGDMFDLAETGAYQGNHYVVSHGSINWDSSTETFTWNIGNIKENETYTLTYRVKIDWSKNPEGNVAYPTNGVTPLDYTDPTGSQSQKLFQVPEVSIDAGMIDVYGYRVNVNGDPIDANGNVVAKHQAELFYYDIHGMNLPFGQIQNVVPDTVSDYTLLVGDNPTAVTPSPNEPYHSVWFGYVKTSEMIAGDVTIRHVDENGQELMPDEVLSGLIGETYSSSEAQIEGYAFSHMDGSSAPASGEFMADEQTVIYVYTKKLGSITITKVDESGEPLAGAVFELSGPNGFSATGTSDENGLIVFDELDWAEYTLSETKAPEGYRLLEGERTISISSDQLHVNETIENTLQDWEIPKTGGIGTIGFYGVGAILMATALFLLWRRRKENE